jgi:hypothetical protein
MDYRFTDIYDRLDTLESTPVTNGYSGTFLDSTSSWVIEHNLSSYQLVVNCFDGAGAGAEKIVPSSVTMDSNNQVTIDWGGTEVNGRVTVVAL